MGIVSWNTGELLGACLDALPAALGELRHEVVVVDNASADDSAAVVRARPGVELLENATNLGYAAAMNQALAGTAAPVLIALNPDTAPPPGSLERLVRRLRAQPEVGLVVPRLVGSDGALQHSVYRFPSLRVALAAAFLPPRLRRGRLGRRWWLEGGAAHDGSGPIDWAIGAVHVIRAAALDGAAPYSERWFMYVEDLELCWRLHESGWRAWLDAEVAIPHVGNAAGARAWGNARAARFWAASYDFHALVHGRGAARAWAAVNSAGVALNAVGYGAAGVLPGARRRQRRDTARFLARLVPLHVRAAVAGAPPPDTTPPLT